MSVVDWYFGGNTQLAAHKVPAMLRFVPSLNVGDSGKMSRR